MEKSIPETLADMERAIIQSLHDEFYKAKSTAKKETIYARFMELSSKQPDLKMKPYVPVPTASKPKVETTDNSVVNSQDNTTNKSEVF